MSRSVMLLVLVFLSASTLIPFRSVSAVSTNSWATKAPMQQARSNLGVAVVDGKIYAIGGYVDGGVVTGVNEEYDPEADTWVFKASMPTPRAYFAIAVYQNKIYCIGGTDDGVNEVYDPATDTWENKTSMPTARSALDANVFGGKIYLIGGFISNDVGSGGVRVALNEVYDPATDSWSTAASMPKVALDYGSAVVDNKIHFIDGYSKDPPFLLHQIYNLETDTWSQGASSPSSTKNGAAGVTSGVNALKRIYVFGDTWNLWEGEPSYTVRIYNPASDKWTIGANMLTSRQGFGVAVVNDMLYIIGGFTSSWSMMSVEVHTTFYATNEQYVPFGYGTADPSYDGTAPEVTVASPENQTYYTTDVALNFSVNEPFSSMYYEIDGEGAVDISGNMTLTGLSYGVHNLTVYATDASGNTGTSEPIAFTVAEEPEPFPASTVVVASTAVAIVIGVSLAAYFTQKRRIKKPETSHQ